MLDCFHGIALGVTDEAHWTTFDPSGGIDTWNDGIVIIHDLALVVRDDSTSLIEGNTRQGRTKVTDGSVESLDGNLPDFSGSPHTTGPICFGALVAEALYRGRSQYFEWLGIEVQVKTPGGRPRFARPPLIEGLVDNEDLFVRFDCAFGSLIEDVVLFIDNHVDIPHFTQLAKLERGEFHLHGSSTPKNMNVSDR